MAVQGGYEDYDYDQAPGLELPKATTPLDNFATKNPNTITKVASTTLSSNFIFVDGKVNGLHALPT